MSTEDASPRYREIDRWLTADAAQALYESQLAAVATVGPAVRAIADAADAAAQRLSDGGRLVYAGAGTSARLGVQDGAELTPTFNWPAERTGFIIAGGVKALLSAVENAEDAVDDALTQIRDAVIGKADVLIAVSASGRTPFTIAAAEAARAAGALTIGVANNPGSPLLKVCDHAVLAATGEEPVAGSTRLKAGTAQKIALNMLSTLTMIRLGRVHQGLMVDMRAANAKLRVRGAQMVAKLSGVGEDVAAKALSEAGGEVRLAVLIARGLAKDKAEALLAKHGGDLDRALAEVR